MLHRAPSFPARARGGAPAEKGCTAHAQSSLRNLTSKLLSFVLRRTDHTLSEVSDQLPLILVGVDRQNPMIVGLQISKHGELAPAGQHDRLNGNLSAWDDAS